ncbi:hypothetical protein BJ165DRAFT_1451652 [Panaeolus papilionaceus]|nr:hypothetical protein BJ165DRAFT_1451652 [Panaeolus papilionaceus]
MLRGATVEPEAMRLGGIGHRVLKKINSAINRPVSAASAACECPLFLRFLSLASAYVLYVDLEYRVCFDSVTDVVVCLSSVLEQSDGSFTYPNIILERMSLSKYRLLPMLLPFLYRSTPFSHKSVHEMLQWKLHGILLILMFPSALLRRLQCMIFNTFDSL